MPVIANNTNHHKWPGVVSRDVMSHVGGLKGEVFTFSGQVKGKTLLPLPPQADAIVKASEQQARLGGMGVTWAKNLTEQIANTTVRIEGHFTQALWQSKYQVPSLEVKKSPLSLRSGLSHFFLFGLRPH